MVTSFFRSEQKIYRSKTGVVGAFYGLLVFGLVFISLLVREEVACICICGGIMFVSVAYYVLVSRRRQRLSPEETHILMIAHVIHGTCDDVLKFA